MTGFFNLMPHFRIQLLCLFFLGLLISWRKDLLIYPELEVQWFYPHGLSRFNIYPWDVSRYLAGVRYKYLVWWSVVSFRLSHSDLTLHVFATVQ